ncbi:MAG: gfo/Idh/MocA family oxidoreductase, partial [Planctomycetia bacterium]|nr:gfo/Idh/MocA family oxidoreductase [Planctomycetia bacterium]
LRDVDVVFLESVDGRPHLTQAQPVIQAGKPLWIDKPMAASLSDVLKIFALAKEQKIPLWSASSLRYVPEYQRLRNGTHPFGKVLKCTAKSPCSFEPHHPDFYWYGIHGVESLFTIMGKGCDRVRRTGEMSATGIWNDGREGTFEGAEKSPYEAIVTGVNHSGTVGKYEGYDGLLREICRCFRRSVVPVDPLETIEIFAFMDAADESKRLGGREVSLRDMIEKAHNSVDSAPISAE